MGAAWLTRTRISSEMNSICTCNRFGSFDVVSLSDRGLHVGRNTMGMHVSGNRKYPPIGQQLKKQEHGSPNDCIGSAVLSSENFKLTKRSQNFLITMCDAIIRRLGCLIHHHGSISQRSVRMESINQSAVPPAHTRNDTRCQWWGTPTRAAHLMNMFPTRVASSAQRVTRVYTLCSKKSLTTMPTDMWNPS